LIGAIFAGFFYLIARYLIPAFMEQIRESRDLLAKQADNCTKAQDEQLKQFTGVMNKQQEVVMQAILKLDTLTKAIDRQSAVIDNLVRHAEIGGFAAASPTRKKPMPKAGGK